MTLDQTLPFLIFSLVAAITPGPGNVMVFWRVVVFVTATLPECWRA
jgi:threonine/homoserine/homoserine lactone efflux protein